MDLACFIPLSRSCLSSFFVFFVLSSLFGTKTEREIKGKKTLNVVIENWVFVESALNMQCYIQGVTQKNIL